MTTSERSAENDPRGAEALAEWLYVRSGGIFWQAETTWQDRHRDEARQWFAYADLLARLTPCVLRSTEVRVGADD